MKKKKKIIITVLLLFAILLFFLVRPVHLFNDKIHCERIGVVTYEDRVPPMSSDARRTLPPLEDGDILLSFSTHTLGWYHGHAGLVIDVDEGKVLEAITMGSDSQVLNTSHWRNYSDLTVLRLKDADLKTKKEIVTFADENLTGIPYKLTSGLFGEKAPEPSSELGVQCASLIWYAYQHFGIDLDSDGGSVVTVDDIAQSPELKVVHHFQVD